MKKSVLLFSFLSFFVFFVFAQKPTSITHEIFSLYVEDKVINMQELIGFTNQQAAQLKELELKYLLDVQKAETCWFCNTDKRIRKLQISRKETLQKILVRDQFIKYDAIENDRIRKGDLRVL
ncbi:MAG: hypothetical protein JJE08_05420 [Proteiniphilum sp.]|nr:hypothetical protein [Proteiniphilum sp.]